MINKCIEYLKGRKIDYSFNDNGDVVIGNKVCWICEPAADGRTINLEDFVIFGLPNNVDDYDLFFFEFGGMWYQSDTPQPKMKLLEYLGECTEKAEVMEGMLGVHGCMDILSGTRQYEDWVEKAVWAGYKALGICEHNTLAGAMKFQLACGDKIKPIIGMSVTVTDPTSTRLKLFVKDAVGWANLLEISKYISIDNNGQNCYIKDLKKHLDGLIVIVDPTWTNYEDIEGKFDEVDMYYQFDPVQMLKNKQDNDYIRNLSKFYHSDLKVVATYDAHYLERDHAFITEVLQYIGKKSPSKIPTSQYFRLESEYVDDVLNLLPNEELSDNVLTEGVENLNAIIEECNFKIPLMSPETRHLPAYILTDEELEKYGDSKTLMDSLIAEGMNKKIPEDKHEEYWERVNMELEVLDFGNVRDYFLILWDIINWARAHNVIVGVGRGSAAGSLIAYLMDITRIDPLEYDLLFERFLNVGRVQKSLPDIDVDFSGRRRDEVKQYITQRYGDTQFCDVGTYTNIKPKSYIKDLGKRVGEEHYILNEMTKYWPNDVSTISEVLEIAKGDKMTKSFFHKHPEVINDSHLVLLQPRAESIHACATIIVPAEKKIHQWFPVKNMIRNGRKIVVSQWEGGELEAAGFLKEDILGVEQLDKYEMMLNRIKEDTGDEIDLYSIPLDDPEVYAMFSRGDNADIFHFGSDKLSAFCKVIKPQNIHELIAANSLFRPGPIEQGFHTQYARRKHGMEEVTYLPGCKEITEDTYGVLCYQEQIMKVCQHVGGLTLVEADSIRKAMVKKNIKAIGSFVDQFKTHAVEKMGLTQKETDELWNILLDFAKYAFNKSHAAAYSVTAYYGQWIKRYHPLQYWATTFSFAPDKKYSKFLSEIFRNEGMEVHPPHINISSDDVVADPKTGDMYWSLAGIKGCGEKAYEQIIRVREEVGGYASFEHFMKTNIWKANKKQGIEGSKVNKTVIESLIASGAFDALEGIEVPSERLELLNRFRTLNKVKVDPAKDPYSLGDTHTDWFWGLRQKALCGIAKFDFEQIACDEFGIACVTDPTDIPFMNVGESAIILGYVNEVTVKKTQKGQNMARINIEINFVNIEVSVWPSDYETHKKTLLDAKGKIICISGAVSEWKGVKSIMADGNLIKVL